jgi:hypothetical protein
MKHLLLIALTVLSTAASFAQKGSDWQKNFNAKINWYKVSDDGLLIVATKDALYGLSTDGQEVWKADDVENIKESNVEFIDYTPYVVVVRNGYTRVIDGVSGKMLFNSNEAGYKAVTKRLHLPKSNKLMFYGVGKEGLLLMMVDLTTGTKLWSQTKLFEKNNEQVVSEAKEINDGVLIATDKRIYKLNRETGAEIYNIDIKSPLPVVQMEKPSGMFGGFKAMGGILGGNKNEANEMQTKTSADFFQHKDDNSFYFWNQEVITKFDAATGKELWKRYEMPSPLAYLLHDERGMVIATAQKTQKDLDKGKNRDRATLLMFDYATGEQKWKDEIDLKGTVVAYKMAGTKLVLATQQDDGDNYITIADLDAGKSVTKKPLSIKGAVRDLQLVPAGLYFRTTEQINILDLESGDKTWKKGFKVKNCIGYNDEGGIGYVSANDIIYKINFNTGDMEELVKGLGFEKKEDPSSLQIVEDKIFISSSQNANLYSKTGQLLYHTYVQAPGKTIAGKLLSGLGGAASAMVAMNAMANSAQLSYAKGYYGSTSPALDNEIKRQNQIASSFGNAAVSSFQNIGKRFTATKQANGFISMLTNFGNSNQAKDAGITIIDKLTGKRLSDMLLGDKTDPDYTIDDIGKVIYYKSDKQTIEGFKF